MEVFFRSIGLEKIGQRFGFILTFCFFVGFFYFLFFKKSGFSGIIESIFLVLIIYFLGRLINKIIYGRNGIFF